MNNIRQLIIIKLFLISFCLCEISVGQNEKLLNGFLSYYNNLPNQVYKSDEGSLQSTQQVDDTTYHIVANLKVKELHNPDDVKLLRCTATVQDLGSGVSVVNNQCGDHEHEDPAGTGPRDQVPESQTEVVEPVFERTPVQLENEVQSDTIVSSGEQFVAIPRDQPSAPCIGCASHVNPQAAGVSDLANLGIRHLDIHEPSVKHNLDRVLDVERQVQVVNGVRYILTLSIISNNCGEVESQDCSSSKICKITILVKPWVKLPNGNNYRAILGNNCTEEWQYGDNGEVLPELPTDSRGANSNDDVRVKINKDLQNLPHHEKTLTDEEIKEIQEQIIPHNQFQEVTEVNHELITSSPDTLDVSKQHVFKNNAGKHNENSLPGTESAEVKQQPINQDKKKAIDDMLDFFDFSGFQPTTEVNEANPRIKRSYDNDLQILSLAEDFQYIRKSIENAKHVYDMAQAMVDYLNEMDMGEKNRVVEEVIKAEEETESFQHFLYVQARVIIPCDKVECEPKDVTTQICNGVIDSTNSISPQILNTFCYNINKERDYRDVVKEIYLEDPVLQTLVKEAVKKIESETNSPYALKINKIVSANTQVTSGTLTKISIIIENTNCNKSVPLALRLNCTVLEQSGSKICEVIIHERYWLKEKKISYTCTDRPVDMRISKTKSVVSNVTVDDPKINEMLQEAIQYLETQSNRNNKQKIVKISSISSQIVAGFLTKIEFVVGYTNCTNDMDFKDQLNVCDLLKNESLRICKAQIWDRSWIIDGKQVEVSCNDIEKENKIEKSRQKRSIDFVRGQLDQDMNNNNTYLQLAKESLKRFLQSSPRNQHYVVINVERVTVQAVSGKLTRIDFTISPTNCSSQKNENLTAQRCKVVNSDNIVHCHSKILEQVWLDKKQYYVNCDTKNQKYQRNDHGNVLREHNPSDSKYYQLAEKALNKYLKETGNSIQHKIVRVVNVTTQIISGLLTSIDFIISPYKSNNTIKCNSKILEKRWLMKKEYNTSCKIEEKNTFNDLDKNDPDNPKYMQIAVESLQIYLRNNPDSHLVRVTFVDKVTLGTKGMKEIDFVASQAEDNDGDTVCHAEYLEERPVRNYINVQCHLIGAVLKKSEITKEDPNYFKYVVLAEESFNSYLKEINSSKFYTIINIENVTVTWDKGMKTLIKYIVSPIELENNESPGLQCISQIQEQPWIHKKKMKVSCASDKEIYRTKRQVFNARHERPLGGLYEQNPSDPDYRVLAEESLHKYKDSTGSSQFLKVITVEKVTTQVVAGVITRIDFVVSDGQDANKGKCHSEVWEQSWLNKKDIKVNCELGNERAKRQVVGGLIEKNPNHPQYKALAEESLQKYKDSTGSSQFLKVIIVEKVTTQLVAGILTRIDFLVSDGQDANKGKCHSEVWEQSWLNKKDITVNCELGNTRAKRQLGGEREENPGDHQFIALAEESLQQYKDSTGSSQFLRVITVEKVTTQVVAGVITRIDFVVSDGQDANKGKCHSEVWEQSWLNKKDITVNCELGNTRAKRQLVGGEREENPGDHQFIALAEESLQQYKDSTGSSQFLRVITVEKVTTQVVAGILTRIDFLVSDGQDANKGKCHSEVWEQSWLNKKDIKVNCELGNERAKRQVTGGLIEKNPNHPIYKALAEESLQKYKDSTGSSQFLKVIIVEKVTTQLVAGILTRIDFLVSDGQDANKGKCHSEVWEQSWLNKKDITVNCELGNTRAKRQLGGEREENPSDHQFIALAEESLQQYKDSTGSSQFLRVITVEKVTTQVVAGVITRIDFVVSDGQDANKGKCHSEVWEQSWLNKKDIKVNCELGNERAKRQVTGGLIEKNPNHPQYKALAEESLQKYKDSTGSSQFLKVIIVEKVTTQLVAGILTRIDFLVSDGQGANKGKCHSEVWQQSWLNKKDITVNCELGNTRAKRQLGGEREENPSDHQFIALAEESLQQYKDSTGSSQFLRVITVEKVTTQVVAGVITRIDFVVSDGQDANKGKCHSEVWEQSWLNKKDITVNCELGNTRAKRQLGGEREENPSDHQFIALAEESLQQYIDSTGSSQFLRVITVEKVTTQVVAGVITRIDFVVSDGQDANKGKCHSEVWEQSWLNKKDIKVNCELGNERAKRQVTGGLTEQSPNRPQYKALAEESLQQYKDSTGSSQFLRVITVEKVTTQLVAGILTRIDFLVSDSQDANKGKCHSEVWEQSWLNKKDIKVNCELGNERAKRQVTGGLIEKNPNHPQYKALAEESLQKYKDSTGSSQFLKVIIVEKVTTQLVAGILTRIDFLVSDGQDANKGKCHSEVWEQSWLNKKDITVNCELGNTRAKRQLGGEREENPSDHQFIALAEESLQQYKDSTGSSQFLRVITVEKVTTQVVAGVITRIDFVVSDGQDANKGKCHSEVWEQSWLNKKDIKVNCELGNERAKRQVTGGLIEKNPNHPQYKALAEESLQKYKDSTGSSQFLKVIIVEKVTTQLVAGILTRIDFLVSDGQDKNKGKCHSEVWEQSWLNKKDITVNCELGNTRAKRQLVGGEREENPGDHQFIALAEESLQQYKDSTGSSQFLRVITVEKVTTQVVAGVITRIDFVVSDGQDANEGKCHTEVWEQSWLNKKDIKVNCELGNERAKRQVTGGLIEKNPNHPQYKALAEESLQKYKDSTRGSQSLKVDRVEKVTTQVVAGILTRIDFLVSDGQDANKGKCHSEVWEQSWLNKKDIKVNCELGNERAKRQVTGGLIEKNPNHPQYKALAEESLQKYKDSTGSSQFLKVIIVEKVTTQLVAGILTRIDFLVSDGQDANKGKCHSEVWEQSWLNKKDITVNCELGNTRAKRQLGGEREENPSDHQFIALAEESLQQYKDSTGSSQFLRVITVEKVTTQVVAGVITRIDFVVSDGQDANKGKCHSEVWEQSWLNKKDIKVNCELGNERAKRQVTGGLIEKNPNHPQYKALAEESLQKYKDSTGSSQFLKVIIVEKVTTQLVAGILTRIDFLVSDGQDKNKGKCHSEVWEQSWLNKKDITVNCELGNTRAKRQLVGGEREENPGDHQFIALAEESLQQYKDSTGSSQFLRVITVEKVTTQVVAGVITRIDFVVSDGQDANEGKCHTEVWEQSWLNKKDIKVNCELGNERAKRQVTGGLIEKNPNHPQYKALAEESLQKYKDSTGGSQSLKVDRVEKVTTQVGAGILTRIDFLVSDGQDANKGKCHSEVWEQSWLNKKDIKVNCELGNERAKRQVTGGLTEQSPNRPQYKALAEESLQQYKDSTGSSQFLRVITVEKVTTQLVAGILTRIDFLVSDSQDANKGKCHSEVWEQSWLNKKDIKVNCELGNERAKRQVTGGLIEKNPNHPQYKALAEESLQKYKDSTGSSQFLKVIIVEKVTTQLVAGILTRIDFLVSDGQDANKGKCHSEVWEQSWLNKKDITVNCELGNTRAKRQLGGEREENPSDHQFIALAEESLQQYKDSTGSSQFLRVITVEKVTTQVVAGVITRIDFVVSDGQDANKGKCHSEVWEQSWLNKKDIKVNCELGNERAKRQVTGGLIEKNPNHPQYKALAEESLQKYKDSTGSSQFLKVIIVEKVTTQLVARILTRIDFLVSDGQDKNKGKCHSEVWEQSWLNKKDITVNCELGNTRAKRQLVGGEREENPGDHQFIALAEESLQQYKDSTGSSQFLRVITVEKVTTQVVAGVITRIDFVVSDGQDANEGKCHTEVWEQSWLNKKDIKVNCELGNERAKRQVTGGLIEKNPNHPQYKALAEESLQKYKDSTGGSQSLKVDRVEKVTTQVVAGILTRIDFLVSDGQDANKGKCHSEVWEQSWLNKKDIKVNCELGNERAKRQVTGGLIEKNPNHPQYKALAEESLQKYKDSTGSSQFLKVIIVEKVTTQLVAGILTRIDFLVSDGQDANKGKCHSEVWEQSWLNKKDITVNCELGNTRAKRQLGGEREENPSDHQFIALAEESLQQYKDSTGSSQFLRVITVEKVTTQVVAGVITRIDFVVSDGQDANKGKCHSEVWEQSWLNKKDIKVNCELGNERAKRQVTGGLTEQSPNRPQYKALAEESLQQYKDSTGSSQFLRVITVEKVTTQLVAGILTRIDFLVSDSQDANKGKCHSEVWEQSWLNKKDIKVNCELGNARAKRQFVGGLEQNPSRPQYKALAEESLQKYKDKTGSSKSIKVDRVVKVTTQVVSGVLTRIDFLVSDSQDSNTGKCHSEVWEQRSLNKKDIKVDCKIGNARANRQLIGGEKEENPSDHQYIALAEESLQQYKDSTGSSQFLKVNRVEKVTKQVVSGVIIRIDFVVSDGQDSNTGKCHSEVWEQSWLNNRDIKVNCELGNERAKRQVTGGLIEKNPNHPQYKALAEESLQKYKDSTGGSQSLKVDRVEKVTTQVVAGILTRIDFLVSDSQDANKGKCHSEVWEQSWLNKKDIKVNCKLGNERAKRQLVGGEMEQNSSNHQYIALAEESLQQYKDSTGSSQSLKVDRVEKVTTQLVNGIITRIDFLVSDGQDSNTVKCHSVVVERSWLNIKDINVSCQNQQWRNKRQVSDVSSENNLKDSRFFKLANESMQKYLKTVNNSYAHRIIKLEGLVAQRFGGAHYAIDFDILPDNIANNVSNCHSDVWENSDSREKKINVSCKSHDGKIKLHRKSFPKKSKSHDINLRGADKERDPNKTEYKLLAEEALRKYEQKSTIHYKVIEVKRVITRVVAGFKYKIDFSASPTECSVNVSSVHAHKCVAVDGDILYCHAEIWDRPWLKHKKIIVQCYGPDDNDFDEYETDLEATDDILKLAHVNNQDEKHKLLAEEASEKYLTATNRKYFHKVTAIHSVSEHIVDGTIIKIEYSMSPTKCLRNETRDSNDTCEIKKPLIVFHCTAKIWVKPWNHLDKDIKVTCKKSSKSKKEKPKLRGRNVRDIGDEDEEIDDDMIYYYADRAVQHVNDQSSSNNLHKLVTIHAVQNSIQMDTTMVRMYIELAETYCLRHHREVNLHQCEEMNGLDHRLCLARIWPSPDDELVVRHVSVVCDDDQEFESVTGLNIPELLKLSLTNLEANPENHFKLVHQGAPQVIPSLNSQRPIKLSFIIAITNCSKDVNLDKNPFQCYIDNTISAKACHSFIWLEAEKRTVNLVDAKCRSPVRSKRSLSNPANVTLDNLEIQKLVTESLQKLEMASIHRYKQRVLQINSHSTKITTGKVTTIDFDVGYTSCLKYEWVENITSCDFLEHLPRRRCIAQIWERLWINNGKNIDVNCVDDETPLESHIEFESAEMANLLAKEALKHIEAKYPHPKKQKVVRIFSLEKQLVAGIHYRMKLEVGLTDCVALSEQTDCKLDKKQALNKFCRVNVWVRPWTDHPPNFRVSCDFQEGATHDLYHHVQAEHLFYNFLTTYNPSYVNDYSQMQKRFEIFKANIKKIHELNVYDKGTATYGVTRFTDLSYDEFSTRFLGLKTGLRDANQLPMKKADIPDIKVPPNFDWREYDAVTEVKDQGSCGSCWAFSVTGNIEGQWKMQSGQLVSLSEQELVDCDKLDDGCNGGLPDNAYRAIEQLGGLELESDYPYEAEDEKCEFNKTLAKVQISGAVNITTNETGMAQWLVHNGPISIGINANAMQFYMGGISHPWKMLCNPTNLDHGVLIVGYGVKDYPLFHKRLPYWIVKNSWGKSWGEQGYYRVFRGDGTCGVNQMASSAVV